MKNQQLLERIQQELIKIAPATYEIPRSLSPLMRVPARAFLTEELLQHALEDNSLAQLINVATLPGIIKSAYAMPDIHEGYGFPIGGVAAMDINNHGVISPGGIGYDINCGVRLLRLSLSASEIRPYLEKLADRLFDAVPSGVGQGGAITLSYHEMTEILAYGAKALLHKGLGELDDITFCEEQGSLSSANPEKISEKARKRGHDQLGTLGSGNHFLEIQKVEKIFNPVAAQAFGLEQDMVTIMIHCGSRGLGHQTCTDYVARMLPLLDQWRISLPDQELACAPFLSEEGQDYFAAMCASANFAWANRHAIGHAVRTTIHDVISPSINVTTVYDISHNMGKRETHTIDGKTYDLIVHRKGATRAFGPGHPSIIEQYRAVGHPVLIPGTMGTASYVMVGSEKNSAFGSSCHGAGRIMSRMKAKRSIRGSELKSALEAQGIVVRCDSDPGLAEEAPQAYKDIIEVVDAVEQAQLAHKVARLVPLAVIKGG